MGETLFQVIAKLLDFPTLLTGYKRLVLEHVSVGGGVETTL